jgi:hypothetical protein
LHTTNTNRTWSAHGHAFCRDSTVDHAPSAAQKAGCFCCDLFVFVALKTLCYFDHQLHWFHCGILTNTLRELCDKMLKILPWLHWPPSVPLLLSPLLPLLAPLTLHSKNPRPALQVLISLIQTLFLLQSKISAAA